MEQHTAKHFALQLGSLACLYLSVAFFLVLVFGLVNLVFPDPLESSWQGNSAASAVRFGFAMTIVFFPTYLVLTRIVNRNRRTSSDGTYLGLTKWLIYLSLLVGGAVLLGDLVAVIIGYLEGELTTRFAFKATAVLMVTGGAFFYYLKDAQGYWIQNEKQSITYAVVAAVIVFGILAVSLVYIETPREVRETRQDEQQVTDLRDVQWAIDGYLRANERLPEGIMAVYDGSEVPTAAPDREPYRYELTESGFNLCAEFSADAVTPDWHGRPFTDDREGPVIVNSEDWQYEKGVYCFERDVRF